MAEKFDLERMLREAAEDESSSEPVPAKQSASRQEIRKMVTGRRKSTRGSDDTEP